MASKIGIGDSAPSFKLKRQDGKEINLADYLGKRPVVLYFYPKNNTRVCTKEACVFRDNYDEFKKIHNAGVIGISSDSVESHGGFSSDYNLPFILLSDIKGGVRRLYGVPKTLGIFPGRVTYVIDKLGIVRKVYSSQLDYNKHVEEAIKTLNQLEETGN